MRNIFSELSYDITQLIKGSGRVILMYDDEGNRTYNQREACKIFAYPDKMMIILTDDGIDSAVDIALSQNTDVIELQDFINALRHLCTNYNVLFNIQKYGKEIEPKDFTNYGSQSSDLNECLEFFNKNRNIVNELFTDDSDINITKLSEDSYQFQIDGTNEIYRVYAINTNEVMFKEINSGHLKPLKNNKNQFIILNSAIKCLKLLFETSRKPFLYFAGNTENGLSNVYSLIYKKLKNSCKNYGYEPFFTNNMFFNTYTDEWIDTSLDDEVWWYFINLKTKEGKAIISKAKQNSEVFKNIDGKIKIDELFNGTSNVDIGNMVEENGRKGFNFEIDGEEYRVENQNGDIVFYNYVNDLPNYKPITKNINQYKVLGAVYNCVLEFLKNDDSVYHFSGDNENGLAKLYSVIFKKLSKDAKNLGYVSVASENYFYAEREGNWKKKNNNSTYWYFFPKDVFDTLDIKDECEKYNLKIFESKNK